MGEIVSTLQTMNKTLEDYIRTSRPTRGGSPPVGEGTGRVAEKFSPDVRKKEKDESSRRGLQMVAVRPVFGRRDRIVELLHWLSGLFGGGLEMAGRSRGSTGVDGFGCCVGAQFFIAEVCQSVEGFAADLGRRFGF